MTCTAPPEVEPTEAERAIAIVLADSITNPCAACCDGRDADCDGTDGCATNPVIAQRIALALAAQRAAAPPRECDDPSHEGPHPKPDEPLICVACSIAHTAEKFAAAPEREREARELLRAWLHSYHVENGPPPLQQTSAWLAGKGGDRG